MGSGNKFINLILSKILSYQSDKNVNRSNAYALYHF